MCQGKCTSECETIDTVKNNVEDCSSNSNNASCRKPKKLESIPIIPTTDNQNAIDVIPPVSEVDNLFLTPGSPSPFQVGKFVDPIPTISTENIQNSFYPSPLKVPTISNIRISENVSEHQNFVEKVTESTIHKNKPSLPKVKEGRFKFQIPSVIQTQQLMPVTVTPINDITFQRKPLGNPVKIISQDLVVPFIPSFSPVFSKVKDNEISLEFNKKPTNNPFSFTSVSLVQNSSQSSEKPRLKSQDLDVPFIPSFSPVLPKVTNNEFSLEFNKKPTNNPIKDVPFSFTGVSSVQNSSRNSEKERLKNSQSHFGEHNLVPSPVSQVEIFQDIKNELGSTTAVPKPLTTKSEEDRGRRPQANMDDLFKLTTVDILKDFSPSPKFPYPNTKGIFAPFLCINILLHFSSMQQKQQL